MLAMSESDVGHAMRRTDYRSTRSYLGRAERRLIDKIMIALLTLTTTA